MTKFVEVAFIILHTKLLVKGKKHAKYRSLKIFFRKGRAL